MISRLLRYIQDKSSTLNGNTTYLYDANGSTTSKKRTLNGATQEWVLYGYNLANKLTTVAEDAKARKSTTFSKL